MELNFTPEQVVAMEKEFKVFLADKDNILATYHKALNICFEALPKKGTLTYTNSEKLVRGEMIGEDGTTFYTWWTTEDILGYALVGATISMFGSTTSIHRISSFIIGGIDVREKFIDVMNLTIETIEKVSEEWSICIL